MGITWEEMLGTLRMYGVKDQRVLAAMGEIDRAEFVPNEWRWAAYEDRPLAIGHGQTISQPYTVARMCELLTQNLKFEIRNLKILEIGTGSGYQTAILAKLFDRVYSIDIVPDLIEMAKRSLEELGIMNYELRVGDGKKGWKEYAPYDGIIVAADAEEIPEALIEQLAAGGRIVVPVRERLMRGVKGGKGMKWEGFEYYVFVPLV
ncbi:protein-L-isoaspartate O-methyltransferase [Candidatus Amesbacteria bacterium RIFCSPHIGHO2_02_FULL_47_9]|uniref:Protein-L-isoaspartate O-methyltransferase n=1 Tax=Candidatus Amesbacteria bacterium RIFCSPHIGHO2_01_FULL_48_32b TaxID=1797253 RepID=A0A1F4YEV5_9BACT|nr:MAG: protein-L-isoaspartate O-methyltransferase [Candidatus Amesbacteria bacterium RIFCSPHIGHO2_01_FULL_48_32b]OGD02715.1 MAG: protein-L-isoaspartate O-methyltransferase [Candidatus Amesbacteria bacterium RIFCSPHIGHO2_02_FULL_47_9]OGD08585.1 MAG: protein-L-isoaspartate O-methyltransferase [Candidatus Amesbacteria bacterium RIFCSPLOWO2_01_FULL_49_25]